MTSALDGIRVIDFGQYIAGPLLGMLLADQGADVIRVDSPDGPFWETAANATWNRGKRSIALDLRQGDDQDTAHRLAESADVVIENFRPGVMERLGLDPSKLQSTNPGLIYCSMPGFAADDPRAGVPAWEGVVGAATATYAGPEQHGQEWRPTYSPLPTASTYAAFQAAVAVGMALLARERDGMGQRVEVPLFDAMFGALGFRGQHPFRMGAGMAGLRTSQYECLDGRWVQFHSGNQNTLQFMEAAGISSWRDEGFFDSERRATEPELGVELEQRMKELFLTRTAQQWEDLIGKAGSEATVCRTSAEWLEHEHALESRSIVEVEDPVLGITAQPGLIVRFSATPGEIRKGAPVLDGDRDEVLAELDSMPPPAIVPPWDGTMRAVLDGVKVLDLCIVLAGPTCGRTMAEYGADVVKIDNPTRSDVVVFHNDINRAKRSILLDLKTERGLEIFWRLVEDADVIVQNYRKGAAERLGIGYEDVHKRRPDIVYASLNSYGHVGPWAERPGHEQLAQAATGMQVRYGGDHEPQLQTNAVNDYGTGFMGAYGIALALRHRERTGEGQHVDAALAYTAVTLQSQFMIGYEGKEWDETAGADALGDGPLHRAYQASDGWLFFAGREDNAERLRDVEGLDFRGVASLDKVEAHLEQRLPSETVDTWVARLSHAGFGAHRVVQSPRELMLDRWVQDHGLSVTRDHEDIGELTTTGPAPRLERTPLLVGRPAPRPGSDAKSILADIGRAGDLDELVHAGVVRVEGVRAS